MKYHFPDYYSEFTCIGGICPDTCCAGWNIAIDDHSLAYYRRLLSKSSSGKLPSEFAWQLKHSVDFSKGTFRLNGRRCALLNEDNLCNLYIHAGKDSLCQTCRTYPRHQEEFGNVREISLSLSCPEAARIILNQPGRPVTVTKNTNRSCPKEEEVDPVRLQWLFQARQLLLDIIWLPLPLSLAVSMALAFAHDLQRRYQTRSFFDNSENAFSDLQKLADRYLAPDSPKRFHQQLSKHLRVAQPFSAAQWSQNFWKLYASLEPVIPQWPQLLSEIRLQQFPVPDDSDVHPGRQLITYYLQVYFPGAIYDDNLWDKTVFSILSWLMTEALAASFSDTPKLSAYTHAAYLYSRQLENNDTNLERILQAAHHKAFHLIPLLQLLAEKNSR